MTIDLAYAIISLVKKSTKLFALGATSASLLGSYEAPSQAAAPSTSSAVIHQVEEVNNHLRTGKPFKFDVLVSGVKGKDIIVTTKDNEKNGGLDIINPLVIKVGSTVLGFVGRNANKAYFQPNYNTLYWEESSSGNSGITPVTTPLGIVRERTIHKTPELPKAPIKHSITLPDGSVEMSIQENTGVIGFNDSYDSYGLIP